MKTLASLFLILISLNLNAQDIPEPDFSQKPYYSKDGKLQEFEKVDAPMGTKAKGMGYGGVEISYSATGLKSPVRFAAGVIPVFIIKMEDSSDPSEVFTVLMAEIKKDRRRFVTGKMGTMFGDNKSNSQKKIMTSSKKIKEKVFEITFSEPLQPGEYAIIPDQKNITMAAGSQEIRISCFGID
jgi:hypothetical protein